MAEIKKRFADYGFKVGNLERGTRNTIADVPCVRVGHFTKIEGDDVRTGITIIDPGIESLYRKKIPAAVAVGNGTGKVAGFAQVEELGTLEAPIVLTNTLAVGTGILGMIDYVRSGLVEATWMDSTNVVVGEINDGRVNNLHQRSLVPEDVISACAALTNEVEIGNVGGGTGGRVFSWKGGIGSASRLISIDNKQYVIGILVQTNYGGLLTMLGVPLWKMLGSVDFGIAPAPKNDGSCMIVVATDAPLSARQLRRIASRVFLGLARTGSVLMHSSGDYSVAFTTCREGIEGSGQIGSCLSDGDLNPFFLGAVDATEESIYDAMFAAETMRGWQGRVLEALPLARVVQILKQYGA